MGNPLGRGDSMNYRELGTRPVSASQPQGDDVRYDDLFIELQEEIDKLSSPLDRELFSWDTVAKLASSILHDHSKDLLVASYLCVALVYLHKGEGLETASIILKDLLDNYWETLYPTKRRIQGRIAALSWWLDRTEEALDTNKTWMLSPKLVQGINERFVTMGDFLDSTTPGAPSFSSLIRKIAGLAQSEKNPQPKAQTPNELKQVHADSAESGPDLPPISLDNPEEALKAIIPLFNQVKQVSLLLREEKSHNPQAYRWLRFAVWEPVKSLPATVEGVTRIAPPPPQTLSHLETLLIDEAFMALLQASEAALSSSRNLFLLDLNYYSWKALSGLGDKYQVARDAVLQETRGFLARLKGLDQLAFSNGTPFLSEKSKEWLNSFDDSHHQNSDVSVVTTDNHIKEELSAIRERLSNKGSLAEAVDHLDEKIRTCSSKKDAMALRLGLARILVSEKQEKIASAHLESVLEDIDRYHLETWDPELALDALTVIFKVYKKHGDPRFKNKSSLIFDRIVKLNTGYGMSL